MTPEPLRVRDHGTELAIGFEDLVKYHGRRYIGGVALAYRLLEHGFRLLGEPAPERERIGFLSGLGPAGEGVADAVEMATRARTRGSLVLDTSLVAEREAPEAPNGGKYYFEVVVGDKRVGLALRPGLIPPEFVALSRKARREGLSPAEETRIQELKEGLAEFILQAPVEDLFEVCR